MFFIYFLLIISILLCIGSTWYLLLSFIKVATTKEAPFISSPRNTTQLLAQKIEIPTGSIVYDLGCGDGRLLRALYKRFPQATYRGIEHEILPYIFFRLKNRTIPKEQLSIIFADFFKKDLSQATHILTYLFPRVMDALLPKLQKELHPGTILISIDFPFSQKETTQIIELKRHGRGLRLFVYEF